MLQIGANGHNVLTSLENNKPQQSDQDSNVTISLPLFAHHLNKIVKNLKLKTLKLTLCKPYIHQVPVPECLIEQPYIHQVPVPECLIEQPYIHQVPVPECFIEHILL